VHFQESNVSGNDVENYYTSKMLGFVTIDGVTEAVIHCSMTPLSWADVEQNFFAKIQLGIVLTHPMLLLHYQRWYIH
jgi:hypothetical protein